MIIHKNERPINYSFSNEELDFLGLYNKLKEETEKFIELEKEFESISKNSIIYE